MSYVDSSWIYRRATPDGDINPEFVAGVEAFIQYACSQPAYMDGPKIRCPCKKCKHKCFLASEEVYGHLLRKGFVPNYFEWTRHGEVGIYSNGRGNQAESAMDVNEHIGEVRLGTNNGEDIGMPYRQMVYDSLRTTFHDNVGNLEEEPNPQAKQFFNLLHAADQELWTNCETMTQLSSIGRILNINSEGHISDCSFDKILEWYNESMPRDHTMVDSFYSMKKLIRGLGLPVEKIDCCKMGCMLYWQDDVDLEECKFCGQCRYRPRKRAMKQKLVPWKRMYYFPVTSRLHRLYASNVTACHMRWHSEHEQEAGIMTHPSDAQAWKHFNDTHLDFAAES